LGAAAAAFFSRDVLPLPLLWGCSISQQVRNSYFLCQKTQGERLSEREKPLKRCRFVLLGDVLFLLPNGETNNTVLV